ncbi:hypothetical protein AMJ74_03980 [candidate division WOR_3 bacterium SM1_77]|jgi:uncharacterized protein (DUF362 family)/Pyruvate/2-oxoacid:ferredoxin oxidoreductase delta subunit|uniref:4Fe-4S ferredoxin-type domain-containing protein n=1 Tax=candidate division WOR_3 bacterium SM1_77 TaxID=1703778 RepID=A0A0S8JWL2_UNCW3|nr:MAG: hypothetical protein AMJ74_03980 [candidate division WOR_3 bacterium SM1_77]
MKKHRVLISEASDLKVSIVEAFRSVGLDDLKKQQVLVKPNMLRPARPEECVVTDPRLIAETVAFLISAGAEVMVGDNPMPDPRIQHESDVADYCGFTQASRHKFRNIGKYPQKVKKPRNLLKEFYISREVLDCDLLVSLPKFKSHELTTMTLSVKNHYGIIPGGLKPYIHALFPGIKEFSKVLVEIYEIRPPDIIIVDCLHVIDAKGKRHHPGLIIAGDNGHAVDYACARLAGIDPLRVSTIRVAYDEGMFDPAAIEYAGTLSNLRGFSVPFVFPFRNSVVEFISRILYRIWLGRVPVIDSARCARCLSCENVCPPRAINGQKIDYSKCIMCYCCLEVCPNQAVRIKHRLI